MSRSDLGEPESREPSEPSATVEPSSASSAPQPGSSSAHETPAAASPVKATVPIALRWAVIVVAPALGTFPGIALASELTRRISLEVWVLSMVAGAALGGLGALMLGLLFAPWLPPDRELGADDIETMAPAPHPERPWLASVVVALGLAAGASLATSVGPAQPTEIGLVAVLGGLALALFPRGARPRAGLGRAAALLAGLALGLSVAPFREAHSWDGPYRLAAGAILVLALAVVALLGLDRGRGETLPTPAPRSPLHRLVVRVALRAALGGGAAGLIAALAASWLPQARLLRDAGQAALALGVVAAALTVVELFAARRARWAVFLGAGLIVPVVVVVIAFLAIDLVATGEPLLALTATLDRVAWIAADPSGLALALISMASCAPAFALLAGARTGALPYLGWRAAWPLEAQVPLVALLGVALVAGSCLVLPDLYWRSLRVDLLCTVGGLIALVVSLRLCVPLERRLVGRWRLLTAPRN